MTMEQKARIAQLRAAGNGYRRIAELLSVPVSTVKSFCQRNDLIAAQLDAVTQAAMPPESPHLLQSDVDSSACRQCGAPIIQVPGRKAKRFCSAPCRMKWWRDHKDEMAHKVARTQSCPACGAVFTDCASSARKYCCRACYMAHRFKGVRAV